MKSGDKIKFGEQYCKEERREDLLGQTIMLTPQLFEEDNGLTTYFSEAPGIYDVEEQEADSIYHLFGDYLENVHDCEVIPATEEDLLALKKEQEEMKAAIDKEYEQMGEYFSNLKE